MSEGINPEEGQSLNEMLSGGEGSVTFEYKWDGFNVPETVTAPDGKVYHTGYMRDGMLQLTGEDGELRPATYERITKSPNHGSQKIKIKFNPTK